MPVTSKSPGLAQGLRVLGGAHLQHLASWQSSSPFTSCFPVASVLAGGESLGPSQFLPVHAKALDIWESLWTFHSLAFPLRLFVCLPQAATILYTIGLFFFLMPQQMPSVKRLFALSEPQVRSDKADKDSLASEVFQRTSRSVHDNCLQMGL